ncbi:MAG: hypothetical protein M3324_02100, partial [Actinomycetota bacterium]|nr:hypothetical protein [Actinomycetota bacterium]
MEFSEVRTGLGSLASCSGRRARAGGVATVEGGRPLRRRSTLMGDALVFGLIGSSALVIGGVIGAYWQAP